MEIPGGTHGFIAVTLRRPWLRCALPGLIGHSTKICVSKMVLHSRYGGLGNNTKVPRPRGITSKLLERWPGSYLATPFILPSCKKKDPSMKSGVSCIPRNATFVVSPPVSLRRAALTPSPPNPVTVFSEPTNHQKSGQRPPQGSDQPPLPLLDTGLRKFLGATRTDLSSSCVFQVLRELKYLDANNTVQLKGRVACEISNHELIITELVFESVLTKLHPTEIAALLSCVVFEQRRCSEPKLAPDLEAVSLLFR